MCEYCYNETYKRNVYQIKGNNNDGFEGNLSIDNFDGLLLECSWKQETSPKTYETMGLAAKFFIKYCPWCGEKLEDK